MTKSPSSPQPRYAVILITLPGFLVGINSSVGMPNGAALFASFALSAAIAIVLDRIKPLGEEGPSSVMAASLGVAGGLAGMVIGYGIGNFVDYIRGF